MSSYLTFKKGNAVLSSHSRSTTIYEAFDGVVKFVEEWQPLTTDAISEAIANLKENIANSEKCIRLHKSISEHHISYDELYEEMQIIQDAEEQIEDDKEAIAQLRLYLSIAQDVEIDDENVEHQMLMYAYL